MWGVVGITALIAIIMAWTAVGPVVVHDLFGMIPRPPVGGRMSNEVLNPPEPHPPVKPGHQGMPAPGPGLDPPGSPGRGKTTPAGRSANPTL